MRRFAKAVLIFLAALLSALPGPAGAAEPARVGTWKTAQTIQPFFYQQMAPSLAVTVFPFTNPADQKMALLAGSLDMCGATLAHAIHAASRGEPVVLVAALCNKCSALVVKKDGPIQSIKDLKGKIIGYVPGTMHEILLREALTKNGLNPDKDVRLTRVDFFDMGMALAKGAIDAFLSGEPFPTLAKLKGYGRILAYPYYGGGIGDINAGMLVKRETIKKNPALVARLVAAHAKATKYLQAHPDKWLAAASTFGVPLPVLQAAGPNMALAWDMDQEFKRRVVALGGRMKALKIIQKEPDYDALIDLSFVERARAK